MRSNSQPVHKPRLPAGRPEHAGISTTLKTKWSFPGCLRRELQRWHHRWFEMEKGRDRGETSACESVCARHTDSDKQGGSENRVKHREAQGEQKIGKDYFRPITSAWPLLTATHNFSCLVISQAQQVVKWLSLEEASQSFHPLYLVVFFWILRLRLTSYCVLAS